MDRGTGPASAPPERLRGGERVHAGDAARDRSTRLARSGAPRADDARRRGGTGSSEAAVPTTLAAVRLPAALRLLAGAVPGLLLVLGGALADLCVHGGSSTRQVEPGSVAASGAPNTAILRLGGLADRAGPAEGATERKVPDPGPWIRIPGPSGQRPGEAADRRRVPAFEVLELRARRRRQAGAPRAPAGGPSTGWTAPSLHGARTAARRGPPRASNRKPRRDRGRIRRSRTKPRSEAASGTVHAGGGLRRSQGCQVAWRPFDKLNVSPVQNAEALRYHTW